MGVAGMASSVVIQQGHQHWRDNRRVAIGTPTDLAPFQMLGAQV